MVRMQILAAVACGLLALGAPAWADEARAEQVYQLCAQCHGDDGGGNPLALAPAIAGLEEWYVAAQLRHFRSGARGTHPDDIAGLRMYPMSLSLREDSDLEVRAHKLNSASADGDGYYELTGLTPGPHVLFAQAAGDPMLFAANVVMDDHTIPPPDKINQGGRQHCHFSVAGINTAHFAK